ncbi:hypothetical protein D2V93_13445 [Flagellimonas taeanensis]|nr:hypothetical protein D2V93_13445 [Allomuricauda taeanensis]
MENITFERAPRGVVRSILFITICLIFESTSAYGKALTPVATDHHTSVLKIAPVYSNGVDQSKAEYSFYGFLEIFDYSLVNITNFTTDCDGDGVSCDQEAKDGTDPNDPCDFILAHQDCEPSDNWKKDDCDGDGVTNGKEKEDGTDPLDLCDFILAHQNCSLSDKWKKEDCDGDGVTNGKEKEDGTDPLDPCDFILAHQNCSPSDKWKKEDCDGDGVSNGQEKEDGTDPLDSCDFVLEHQDCEPSDKWKKEDCDGDGVSNGQEKEDGTDPLDPCDFVLEHQDCEPSDKWKKEDCDGDGVSNGQEKEDGTDPLDPCDFVLEHQDCEPSDKWKKEDCDGDGVSNGQENEDGTDPLDSCDFVLEHQDCEPSDKWKKEDCDGDGVTNEDEKEDGTDPLDPCDYKPESVTLPQSGDYLDADCDGDGVTNEDEEKDGTDPQDPCSFVLGSQTVDPSSTWNASDCDGDGVTNEDEKEDGTDPLDPCDYKPESVTLPQSGDYLTADCDGDGVTNEDEEKDGTDPQDPCSFVLGSQTMDPSSTWNASDCDGDGVTNEDEKEDGTDPLDPCDYKPESVTLPQSGDYLTADCDGDGVTNEDEEKDGTDPQDPCSFVLGSQTVDPSSTWNASDCDGDGVTNEDEKEDGTNPLDPCDYNPDSITLTPSADWEALDCDDDGNPNGTDPDPLVATARDDSGSTPALTEVAINILENDDYLPNDDGNNLGVTSLSRIGGNALGTVTFDAETGLMTYTPVVSESNTTVTVIYEVCNVLPDPSVCASATVYIQVGANTIDAVDDSFIADGETGGVIPDSNVLSNDTLNGETLDLSDVILTSTPTDVLTINPDGSVNVEPGTADGTYTIDYTICEAANVDNCDTATVTVEVSSGMGSIIDAVDDSFTADGETGGVIPDSNVLSNDTLNGETLDLSDVIMTSTPTDVLTINPDGSVSVEPGTADGTYTIDYTICEAANVGNCDTATVTVEVSSGMGNIIDAVDDSYTAYGGTGGVIPDSNVLSNDTLNGETLDLSDVILTSTPTNVLTINPDGSVSVAPGTESGAYTIDYTICEAADTGNCDTATVTVIVVNIEVNQMLTPNGDLKNDFLFIRGVNFIKSSTIKIFNRWGTLVYEGKDYDNVRNVFDGRVRGKSALNANDYLPAGVYFYIFNYETAEGSFTDSEYIYISR